MNQDDVKELFRTQELARRAVRRQRLLNEAALCDEPPAPEDEKAYAKLREVQESYQELVAPRVGYWKRLWLAIQGRNP